MSDRSSRGRKDSADPEAFRLLLATTRPAVHSFFVNVGHRASSSFVVSRIHVGVAALDQHAADVDTATTAVVDIGLDQAAAVEMCEELQRRRAELPVTALLCCPQSATPWNLRALLAAGVSSVLDLQATSEEALRALQSVARGGAVLHLQSRGGRRGFLREIFAGANPRGKSQMQLLDLVALGLPDHEIGRRLHLSPHTVKHHIENLRSEIGVKNRIELAAWAGRHGFYAPDAVRDAS